MKKSKFSAKVCNKRFISGVFWGFSGAVKTSLKSTWSPQGPQYRKMGTYWSEWRPPRGLDHEEMLGTTLKRELLVFYS